MIFFSTIQGKAALIIIVILSLLAASGWALADMRGKDLKAVNISLNAWKSAMETCDKEREISYATSEQYQNKLSALDLKLKSLRVQYSAACIKINPPGGSDATAAPGKLSGPHGLNADALLDFAADCERERLKVIGLQEYSKNLNE